MYPITGNFIWMDSLHRLKLYIWHENTQQKQNKVVRLSFATFSYKESPSHKLSIVSIAMVLKLLSGKK